MKQHITKEQFDELTENEQEIVNNWLADHGYKAVSVQGEIMLSKSVGDTFQVISSDVQMQGFPSIGQMIEFLDEEYPIDWAIYPNSPEDLESDDGWHIFFDTGRTPGRYGKTELCDALWEAVKYALGKQQLKTSILKPSQL